MKYTITGKVGLNYIPQDRKHRVSYWTTGAATPIPYSITDLNTSLFVYLCGLYVHVCIIYSVGIYTMKLVSNPTLTIFVGLVTDPGS